MPAKHGYLLPTVINPPRICIQLEIPNDEAHLRAFWGQLDALGSALTWDNDEGHTALPVSAVWREVYETARDRFYGDGCMGCCPDEEQIAYQTWVSQQRQYQQYLAMMDDGDTAASFGAPATFNGDNSPNRQYALCRTINNMVMSAFNGQAMAIGAVASIAAQLIGMLPFIHPIEGVIGQALEGMTQEHLMSLSNNCDAFRAVSCCMKDGLTGQDTTIENLQSALGACGFSFGTPEAEISAMVNAVLQDSNNARAFIASMKDDYLQASKVGGANAGDCECECGCEDTDDINLISLNGCTLTKLNATQWRVQQSAYTILEEFDLSCGEAKKILVVEFKDALDRCIDITAASQAMAGWQQVTCSGLTVSGVGGGGGQGKRFRWYITPCFSDPTVWDCTITLACVD